ncbi:hypothetical protein [Teredinibacter purpureus]|uniref:hypothetical protein n=1 Tax=Teredinibacter purpureus TaxID=2731756 RepID=UPI000696EDB6|nr:hypothetical protein [Teredinibacter purpureus]
MKTLNVQNRLTRTSGFLFISVVLSACEKPAEEPHVITPPPLAVERCTDPRPELCTMNYDPVCATHNNGNRTTEANNCTACATATVEHYSMEACAE